MKRPTMPTVFGFDAGAAVLPAGAALTMEVGAETWLSPCGRYRYLLKKPLLQRCDDAPKVIGWFMLNPSDGTATVKDPTLGRVYEFSEREGASCVVVGNLFNLRSPDPTDLLHDRDPLGPEAEKALERFAKEADMVIVAWGSSLRLTRRSPPIGGRDAHVLEALLSHHERAYCLGTNADGQPKHPLYLPGSTKIEVYATRASGIVTR